MRYSSFLTLLAAPLAVSAAPARFYGKRAESDILVFTFADVLEQLESQFYTQAIAKFQESDFTAAGFTSASIPIEQFTVIQGDEIAHSVALQAGLKAFGATPVTSCVFNFDSVLTDVTTMAATARLVENLGVAAYLGGATLLTDPVLLDAAGSILTIEARHQTILNLMSGAGTAIPQAFDIPFSPSEVLAVASPFISGCDLGIPANPTLSVTNTEVVLPGTLLSFESVALNGTVSEDSLFCNMITGGAPFSISLPLSECVVPEGINGPVAIWITSDATPLINNVRDRAVDKLIAGPTMAFIDIQPQTLGQMARIVSGAGSAIESVSTETISPEAASSIINSAGTATATGEAASGTDSAVAPAETANAAASANFEGTAGGPNTQTGPSGDGSITVNGWSNPPAAA